MYMKYTQSRHKNQKIKIEGKLEVQNMSAE